MSEQPDVRRFIMTAEDFEGNPACGRCGAVPERIEGPYDLRGLEATFLFCHCAAHPTPKEESE